MATVLGMPQATVALYDRVLSEHGLRSKGGRGRSAAKMNSRDIANLLIAVIASPISGVPTRDAARACETFASLPKLGKASRAEQFAVFGLTALANLPKKHLLVDALAKLIEAASGGERFVVPSRYRRKKVDDDYVEAGLPLGPQFRIDFEGPNAWAQIMVDVTLTDAANMARLVYFDEATRHEQRGDLNNQASIGFTTIRALGSLIKTD
jgi:hypothetical protein